MYNIIYQIIDHVYQTGNTATGDQQYIYYGCISLILLLTIWILDRISVFIINISKGGK